MWARTATKGYIRFRDAYGSEIVMQNSEVTITAKGSSDH